MTKLSKKMARHGKITAELQMFPQMRVGALAKILNVSAETVRRDLAELANQGSVSRTHGGAVSNATGTPGLTVRQNLMIAERNHISDFAISQIEPNDLLMVGGGSTTMRFALRFSSITFPLTIITHSLPFAMMVSKNSMIKVELLPGNLDPSEGLVDGISTVNAIRNLSVHKAFIGASGVTKFGLNALLEPGQVYGAMIERADKAFVLADHTKFEATSLALFSKWESNITLISDKKPDGELLSALEAASVTIFTAD